MSAVSIPELVKHIGLEELASMERSEMIADFLPAAITGFADGDMITMHEPYSGRRAELYGENHYTSGLVTPTLAKAAIENGMLPGPIYDFQGFAAEYFTQPGSPFASHDGYSSVRIYPEVVTVDGNIIGLKRPPVLIFDLGACLTGRSLITDQMQFLDRNQRPFIYSPLTRLHFTNQILINTYRARYGVETATSVLHNGLYIGREDGIAAATHEVIQAQTEHDAPVDIADVILALGAQHTTPADMKQGIENAFTLLAEDGLLVIRALARPAADELGTKEIESWAYESGFQENKATYFSASIDQIGSILQSGHYGDHEIATVVLSK